jgi:AraC-like DNA-binding protein
MNQEHNKSQNCIFHLGDFNTTRLFPGIDIAYVSLKGDKLFDHHEQLGGILIINYCKSGRIGRKMANGNYVYLGKGDFSVHTMKLCADSEINLPNNSYEGVSIYIDLKKMAENPPQLLSEAGITAEVLFEKLCKDDNIISFIGNEQTESIFKFFYNQSEGTRLAYQKIKVLELLLYLYGTEKINNRRTTEYQAEQIEVIRNIHRQLMDNLERRFTIEELSKQYLMNPTTMKSLFKSVYGTSIAAHMKEHRMEKAAKMLLETEMSISQIAAAVGYVSQSKFSTAFKSFFHILPKEYRKSRT